MADSSSSALTPAALTADVLAARTATEALSALGRGEWHRRRGFERACPASMLPDPEGLGAWLPDCPEEAWAETAKHCVRLHARIDRHWPWSFRDRGIGLRSDKPGWITVRGDAAEPEHDRAEGRVRVDVAAPVAEWVRGVHRGWRDAPYGERGRHPLGPLVRAWQARALRAEPDRRDTGIMPSPLRVTGERRADTGRLFELAGYDRVDEAPTGLLPLPDEPAYLPGLEPEPQSARIVPALPLVMFDATGRPSTSPGRGASLGLRLYAELLMAVPRRSRGFRCELRFTLRELLSWLWPNGAPSPARYWPQLQAAVRDLREGSIPWDEGKSLWHPIQAWSAPRDPYKRDGIYRFEVRLPPGSEVGPRVYRPTLRLYGLQSAPKYRAWLGLAYLWGEHLRRARPQAVWRGGGIAHGIEPPRLPVVERDRRTGGILDATGRPVKTRSGEPVRSPFDRRAVPVPDPDGKPGTERNPAMDRLPELGPRDLLALTTPDSQRFRYASRRALRAMVSKARKVLEAMAGAGDIVIERETDGGWRILPPNDILERFRR